MARNENTTKKKQSKASLRALAATKPKPQTFGLGKAARKEAAAINKKARKGRQIPGRSVEQEPRDEALRMKQRRASDSPPLLGRVEDRVGTINATDRCASLEAVSRQPSKAKKGSKGDVSKRKQAMKAVKRQARAKKKASTAQRGARERAKGAKRRIEQLKRAEQSLERREQAYQVVTEASCPPQPSDIEVDGFLNLLEPLLRNIYKTQNLVQASTSTTLSFTAASPSRLFIPHNLGKARSIITAYEGRGWEILTPLQEHALRLARLAVEELEYMERSDEEERRGGGGNERGAGKVLAASSGKVAKASVKRK